ncbi:hypothetical protein WN55_04844 [Dufourea novaeangliae]|uniref:Uncharacterized protein n=1 Tax=Dufourea novaeangliae TaxID=178035 RepID=A0A154P101_DUFNO|nr:hypothetical protein WN55_04844 [Dufourea novaeangliae]
MAIARARSRVYKETTHFCTPVILSISRKGRKTVPDVLDVTMSSVFAEEPRVPPFNALEDHEVDACKRPARINLFSRVTLEHKIRSFAKSIHYNTLAPPLTNPIYTIPMDTVASNILHFLLKSRTVLKH